MPAGGAASAPVLLSCADGDHDQQRRGTACLCCHAGEFGAAGSIDRRFAVGARIEIDDATGRHVDAVANAFGNFFSHEQLVAPLRPRIVDANGRVFAMREAAPDGNCNRCHAETGVVRPLGE